MPGRSRLCSRRRFDDDAADADCLRGDRGAIQIVGDDDKYGCDDEEHDGGDTRPVLERVVAEDGRGERHKEGGDAAVPRNISRDTATMLERSRTLVARAKVGGYDLFFPCWRQRLTCQQPTTEIRTSKQPVLCDSVTRAARIDSPTRKSPCFR